MLTVILVVAEAFRAGVDALIAHYQATCDALPWFHTFVSIVCLAALLDLFVSVFRILLSMIRML